jgi:HEAT repeat protein
MRSAFILTMLAALAVATGATNAQKIEKPPDTTVTEIGGKTMQQWIEQLHSLDPSKRENAIRTILLFGPDRAYEAMDDFIKELEKTRLQVVDLSVRVNLAIAVGFILGNVKDPNPKHVQKAVALLTPFLSDTQSIMRYRAAQAIGSLGTDAKTAIPQLISLTKDKITWETRQAGALALGTVAVDKKNGPAKQVLLALYEALGDNSSQVRLAAIQSLTWLGPPADPQLRLSLEKALEGIALKEPEQSVRIWAYMSVMQVMGKVDERWLVPIGKLLKTSPEMGARIQAAQALGTVGSKAKSQIPALDAGLDDKQAMVVYWCIWGLGRMESAAMPTVPRLKQISADEKRPEPIKRAADEAIAIITGKKSVAPKGGGQ